MDKKKVSVSITDFAVPVPRRGSIDSYSGYGRGLEDGIEIHQRIQTERKTLNPNYQAEVAIKESFEKGNYIFEVSGRMDGLFTGPEPIIEEIKSSFNVYELWKRIKDDPENHPYCLQLMTYGYFYWRQNQIIPELNLHLVSSRNADSQDWNISLDIANYETWIQQRLSELVEEADRAEKRAQRRKKAGNVLQFPFSAPRPSQLDLIQTIENNIADRHRLLIQAPTGLGKTIGVLYPTMKDALERGQQVLYVTPKNSQHAVAEDAIERMQGTGASIKSMTLTAKSKMCFKNEPICNPEFCEFAKDHYTKMAEHGVAKELSKKRKLTSKAFKKIAEQYQVCPFELQLEAVKEADTVICDYNYVFAPNSALARVPGIAIDQEGKPNLVIDEAHNLPSRSMDFYSSALSVSVLEKMRDDVQHIPKKFQAEMLLLIGDCIRIIENAGPKDSNQPTLITPSLIAFIEQDEILRTFLSGYLSSDVDIKPKDVVLRLSFYWSEFTGALEFLSRHEFFASFSPRPATIRITCCDASEMLKERYDSYQQIVGFSATLKPFDYYSRLSGLNTSQLKTAEFASPFPKENRKLLIIPQISSKYSQRQMNYPRVAEAIHKISSLRKGNYFAFFPSFDFMEKVLNLFTPPAGTKILRQERFMKKEDVESVLEMLSDKDSAHIIFAVQGGIFSEGIDYPGDMIIGAFVVGPPLPSFDLEREQMRTFYEDNYGHGFDYAYTYPAMAKAVQAAGRVIRSETDRGIIVLMDDRFIQPSYTKSMPQDWFEEDARELISNKILKDISDFWEEKSTTVNSPEPSL